MSRAVRRAKAYLAVPARDEQGSVTPFVVIVVVALLAVSGLVIDGGCALGEKRKAMNVAEQAARVGSDALNEGALRDGMVRVDPGGAVVEAERYLRSVGAKGTVEVDGDEVRVTVTGRSETAILSAVGVRSLRVEATATAVSIDEDDDP